MAKRVKHSENLVEIYGAGVEYVFKANEIVANGVGRLVGEQIDLVNAAVEELKPLAQVKEPQDFVDVQVAVVKGLQGHMVAAANSVLAIQKETVGELTALAEQRVKDFAPAALSKSLANANAV